MPNTKSIIVIGQSYNYPSNKTVRFKYRGYLSKSSRGLDYHIVLKEKMENLVKEILKFKSFSYKIYVDTGPLIDRELAEAAGIGYFGKNCSIINDKYGSFIAIGYILTDLEMTSDETINDDCGSCDLCIRACPTGALSGDYKVNPKKCISYLTQTKEDIEEKLRRKMGVKIFGCDTCQLVCPKNKGILYSKEEKFHPGVDGGHIDLLEFLKLTNRDFKDKYGKIAGSWRGRNILKRNVIIALANIGNKEVLDYLYKESKSESKMISYYARWAIGEIIRKNNR